MTDKLQRILLSAEKLAGQVGGAFTVDPSKLADFQRREAALKARHTQAGDK